MNTSSIRVILPDITSGSNLTTNTQTSIKYKDSVPSDINIVGINPVRQGPDRVVAVSCKSWQDGFNPKSEITQIEENKKVSGQEAWKSFREITRTKWAEAFIDKIEEIPGSREFAYTTAATILKGDKSVWESHPGFSEILHGKIR